MTVSGSKRIEAMDILRGAAVLGILLMNIQTFAMIEAAYVNPTAYGEFTGMNALLWGVTRLFADQKFMALFSLLFGAGIVLMSEKAVANGRRAWAAHYRRMFVLLVVGFLHAYFLWYGDILTLYALCGLVVYWAWKWQPAVQLAIGLGLLVTGSYVFGVLQGLMDFYPADVMDELQQMWKPDESSVQWELGVYRGSYWGQMEHRAPTALELHTTVLLTWFGWRVGGLMLIGMSLFKWKIFGAYRSPAFYKRMVALGLGIGLPLEAFGVYYQHQLDWQINAMIPGLLFNYFSSLFIAAGYLGLIMLFCQSNAGTIIKRKLASVGRMAFTNYLTQTVICTTIFYGHGFGWFGHLERWHMLMVVLGVWIAQIAWSEWWLARFQNGPLEWLWRCATYLRILPLRKPNTSPEVAPPTLRLPAV